MAIGLRSSHGGQMHGRSFFGDASELWVVQADGTDPTKILEAPGGISVARWSPDGGKIAFIEDSFSGPGALFVADLRSGDVSFLALTDTFDWSPTGKEIVYPDSSTLGMVGGALHVIGLDGEHRYLTRPTRAGDLGPVWSPDGNKIAFTRFPVNQGNLYDGPYADIWTVDVTSGAEEPITRHQDRYNGVEDPTWSPDSRRLAFNTVADDFGTVIVADVNAKSWVPVVDLPFPRNVSRNADWSADGRELVLELGGGLFRVSAERGEPRPVVPRSGEVLPDWAPC